MARPDDKDFIPAEIFRQAKVAFEEAAAIVMVVDARTEIAGPDRELARLLARTGKPLFLAVNKMDSDKQDSLLGEFHSLGMRNIFPVSAEHGRGIDDLLDAILLVLPARPKATTEDPSTSLRAGTEVTEEATGEGTPTPAEPHEIRVAIIGHPNVGKSTLLNQLTGTDRAIVSPVAGTTRDSIDEVIQYKGRKIRFIDTAGIRRKGKTRLMAEKLSVVMARKNIEDAKLSVVMARKNIEDADIVLFMVDATEGASGLDANIAGYAHESGRSVIILVNKWDLVASGEKRAISQSKTARIQDAKRPQDRALYEERLRYGLKFLAYAPVLFLSAHTGKGTEKILPLIEKVAAERRKRVTTGEMNRFLRTVDFERASVPMSKRVRILYMTQAGVAPPTFVLFTDRAVKLHFSYQRFLENQIRAAFGFVGSPIWIKNRARD
ncbi:GTPase Der [Candidatus Sulfotelmatobacter sp. SbA7]|nr:GTPase Der [Candidatus Sulfotelmatobacter sp. SbA7]